MKKFTVATEDLVTTIEANSAAEIDDRLFLYDCPGDTVAVFNAECWKWYNVSPEEKSQDSKPTVDELNRQVDDLQSKLEKRRDQAFIHYLFFVDLHPELIPELVELAYKKEPESAKNSVSDFHDETLDLSTLECTGKDFTPWGGQ